MAVGRVGAALGAGTGRDAASGGSAFFLGGDPPPAAPPAGFFEVGCREAGAFFLGVGIWRGGERERDRGAGRVSVSVREQARARERVRAEREERPGRPARSPHEALPPPPLPRTRVPMLALRSALDWLQYHLPGLLG